MLLSQGDVSTWLRISGNGSYDLLTGTLDISSLPGPKIVLTKYHPEIEDSAAVALRPRVDFQTWHHFCFVFTSQAQFPYPGGYVNLTNYGYMDGVSGKLCDDIAERRLL